MFKDKLNKYHKEKIKELRDEIATLEKAKSDLEKDNKRLKQTLDVMKRLQDETLNEYQKDMEEMKNFSMSIKKVVQDTLLGKSTLEEQLQSLTEQLNEIGKTNEDINVENQE